MRDGKLMKETGPEVVFKPEVLLSLYDVEVNVETVHGRSKSV
jgi:ABC-type enterochelin transport system ATPase subunit